MVRRESRRVRIAPAARVSVDSTPRPAASTFAVGYLGDPEERTSMATIESVSHETRVFDPPPAFVAQANVKKADFDRLNASAAADYAGFWSRLARETLLWHKPFSKSPDESNHPFYKWFEDGELNVSYNCLERNLENGNAGKVAIIFEADDGAVTKVTYEDLYPRVCRF